MDVNTNLSALDAMRHLGLTGTMLSQSVERLSSGLRINHAADDAAGLTISQVLTSQIRGLTQANRNVQDAMSMIQTGEGALNEVQDMMQRMRELAVQAANGTLNSTDEQAINSELQSLQQEINSVSTRTTFNGQFLLDGSLGVTQSVSGSTVTTGAVLGTAGTVVSTVDV